MLTRLDILGSDDLAFATVQVPEWNGEVRVRMLTAGQRDKFESEVAGLGGKSKNMTNLRARLVVLTACDQDGEQLFKHSDIEALSKKSAAAVDKVFSVSAKLNGFTSSDIEELEGE